MRHSRSTSGHFHGTEVPLW
ncbi:unnamed protein product, partial [Rotaria sp. Silwood2]